MTDDQTDFISFDFDLLDRLDETICRHPLLSTPSGGGGILRVRISGDV